MADPFPVQIEARLRDALAKTGGISELPVDLGLTPSKNPQFGDYQANTAMVLAKPLKMNPRDLASEIVGNFDGGDLCEAPDVAGPGFINFRLKAKALETRLTEILIDPDRLGVPRVTGPKTIVIDFSAPNVAKQMHIGHIRSTIIGDCLARIARFLGHEVVTDNHIGDWGTQFGMVLWGWKNLLDRPALEKDPVGELLRIYREVNARQKDDEAFRETCKAELVKLQGGDPENLEIWQQCVDFSKQGLQKIYGQLDITFDHWLGESFYNDRLEPLVEQLLADGVAKEADGAVKVFSDGKPAPKEDPFLKEKDGEMLDLPFVIRKSDGGFLYATTDLATIDHRLETFGADAIWYVVGAPQQLHFDQLFAAVRRRGIEAELKFIPFGSILGKDRKMLKTRDGEVVQLADVLDEAVDRARKIIEEKNPELKAEEKAEIARIIGIGSVKYAELSQFRMTDYVFDWDTMLNLKGNTAPYLINAYVRTRSIFRKLGSDFAGAKAISLSEDAEKALALKLAQFAEIVPTILNDFRTNALAAYLYELATTYHAFYEKCPILRSEGAVLDTRLALCELTGQVLKKGLGLLGIRTTERM